MEKDDSKMLGYYVVIPNEVMFDEKLMANAKLLYGQIALLTEKEGYCWATNKFFANKNNTSEKSISKWINNLADNNYIKLEYEHLGISNARKIFLNTSFKHKK